jgi:hypothetical protein
MMKVDNQVFIHADLNNKNQKLNYFFSILNDRTEKHLFKIEMCFFSLLNRVFCT